MEVLLDSHVLIFYFSNLEKLSSQAAYAIERAESLFISVATLVELSWKASTGRLELSQPFDRWFSEIKLHPRISLLPINEDAAKASTKVDKRIRYPFDRMIVGTAISKNLPFITKDANIREFSNAETIW